MKKNTISFTQSTVEESQNKKGECKGTSPLDTLLQNQKEQNGEKKERRRRRHYKLSPEKFRQLQEKFVNKYNSSSLNPIQQRLGALLFRNSFPNFRNMQLMEPTIPPVPCFNTSFTMPQTVPNIPSVSDMNQPPCMVHQVYSHVQVQEEDLSQLMLQELNQTSVQSNNLFQDYFAEENPPSLNLSLDINSVLSQPIPFVSCETTTGFNVTNTMKTKDEVRYEVTTSAITSGIRCLTNTNNPCGDKGIKKKTKKKMKVYDDYLVKFKV